MIGIVVVSHSRALARAAVALASEMVEEKEVRLEIAAGLDDDTLGTDAVAVTEAIAAADSGAGVLILMDLGSAVLSAELALELLAEPHEVRLCGAPLVEGLVAAAVAAAGGATLAEAAEEAENALLGKATQLGAPAEAAESPGTSAESASGRGVSVPPAESASERGVFVVTNEHGLHARPAARLVGELRGLDAEVTLRNLTTGAGPAAGRSLSRIAALGALAGHEIEVTATGSDAAGAVARILELAARRFGEESGSERPVPQWDGSPIPGTSATPSGDSPGPLPASAGIGIGAARHLAAPEVSIPDRPSGPPDAEDRVLDDALAEVAERIRADIARAAHGEAEIFQAHLLLLEDDELLGAARRGIAGGAAAAAAWAAEMNRAADELDTLADDYQRARAADLRAVRDQVLAAMLGQSTDIVSRAGVLIAADLTPAQVASLDRDLVTGMVLAHGSPTAHAAIIARAKGIPAVTGAGEAVLGIPDGTRLALDGGTGELAVDPDPALLADFAARAEALRQRRELAAAAAHAPAVTADGVPVHVAANVGGVDEAVDAVRQGADLAGLVRTEFLFLGRRDAPSVDEQERVYRAIAEAFDGRRVVLRTLDVGGDKPLPYVDQPPEQNPFLGQRGIRLALAHPDLLRDQLRAIARVAADHPVGVMFPMVTTPGEIAAARALLDEIAPTTADLEVGIMVEVPATAAKSAALADSVDFFSIGTNDLTQYAMAAERGNESVATLSDPLDPGVLHLIDRVCRGAGSTRVAVCGEVAADPVAIPLLLGLGVTELSVTPPAIPLVKAAIRELDLESCRAAAARALTLGSAAEVRSGITDLIRS